MGEKCRVVVCTGTACYVLGGAEILTLEESLPAELQGRVALEGATCLGLCRDRSRGHPPFVTVDGNLVVDASLEKVVEAVRRALGAAS